MKIKWSKPMDKKFISNEKSLSTHNYSLSKIFNMKNSEISKINNESGSLSKNYKIDNFNKNLAYNKANSNNIDEKKQHFINIKEYIFYFKESEVFIFKIEENKSVLININNSFKIECNVFQQINQLYSKDTYNDNENQNMKDILLEDIKKINFLAYDENITNSLLNKNNNNILLSTDFGIVNIININLKDFFIELLITFDIKQNYLYSYDVFDFCDSNNNVILGLDNNVFICEIYNKQKNQPIQVFKNCLFKSEYLDEKPIYAEKQKNLVAVFSNKAIYLIDLNDISTQIFYKKENKNNFGGRLFNDNIVFIKDENTYAVHSIKDNTKKLSFKLSSKNQLNILNFEKIIYLNGEFMVITNKKNTEIYMISLTTYKIINRESILFENPNFLFLTSFGEENEKFTGLSNKEDSCIISYSVNRNNLEFKYKIGNIINNCIIDNAKKIDKNNLINNQNSYLEVDGINKQRNEKSKFLDDINNTRNNTFFNEAKDLSIKLSFLYENSPVDRKNNDQMIEIKNKKEESYELSEFETDFIQINNAEELIRKQICYINICIKNLLKIINLKYHKKIYNSVLSEMKFLNIKNQINILINVLFYLHSLLDSNQINIIKKFEKKVEHKIIITWIQNFGSYSLRISNRILIDYIQLINAQQLFSIVKLAKELNDNYTFFHVCKKYGTFLDYINNKYSNIPLF